MARNPLYENLNQGRTSIGLYVNTAEMVELCGFIGFHWVMIDQMFTSNDWQKTEELIRAGEAAGITPVVRVQSNPWLGYDHRIAVDVSRAIGIGAQFVMVSNSGKQEIDDCITASHDWHRRALTLHPYKDFGELMPGMTERNAPTFVIPQPESKGGLDALEEVIADPDIKIVFLGMTDASRILAGSPQPDFYNRQLWEYVDKAVALGAKHGVTVGANTSYAYSFPELKRRVEMLHEHGVRVIMVQGATFLFQLAATQFLSELAPIIG